MARHIEDDLQAACIRWFDLQHPGMSRLLYAVPNGGKRNLREAARLKRCGVRAGISDLVFLKGSAQHNSLCIELKVGDNRQSEYQKDWQELVEKHGNKYVICRSLEQFMNEITKYLKSE